MAGYAFLSTWVLDAPRESVWRAIEDVDAWPDWWRGVISSERTAAGDEHGVGRAYRVRWRGAVPYAVEFEFTADAVEAPAYMAGHAVGQLEGTGVWRLREELGTTVVTYDWRVRTTKAWMNAVAPVARPMFKRNHDWAMARGGEGLARLLDVRLLSRS